MIQHEPGEAERELVAMPAQGQTSEHDPFSVEHDRFLEELIKAVDEDAMREETLALQETMSPVPSAVSSRSERVRYSFD